MQIVKAKDPIEGIKSAKEILYKNCNSQTALFLSGGSTPKVLYQQLTTEQKLKTGSVALVDERYEEPMHENSNEKMIEETGLFKYFESQSVPVFNILNGQDIQSSTKNYEGVVSQLLKSEKKIAILGIGTDGHIAGLPAGVKSYELRIKNEFVGSFEDFPGEFKSRITLTFKALEQMDLLIVLVFGREKGEALEKMFTTGNLEQVPASFLNKREVKDKTILITDQIL